MLTEELDVGLPFASNPGVITTLDATSSGKVNTPAAPGSTWNCVLACLIISDFSVTGPNT